MHSTIAEVQGQDNGSDKNAKGQSASASNANDGKPKKGLAH